MKSFKKSFPEVATQALFVIIACILALVFINFIAYSFKNILYPFPIDRIEGIVLNLSKLLTDSTNYYLDINDYPFINGTYPPVYPIIVSFFIRLDSVKFLYGRLLSFISSILIVFILYKIFSKESKKKTLSIILSLIFIAPYFVLIWSSWHRVDMLALFFSITGLHIYMTYYKNNSRLRFFAILFFLFAFFTKQNAIAAPLSVAIYLLLKDKKEFLKMVGIYFSSLVFFIFFLNFFTDGRFYLHTFAFHASIPFNKEVLYSGYSVFITLFLLFFIFFLLRIFIHKQLEIYTIYFIVSFILLSTFARLGSSTNYFLEPFLGLLLVFGLTFIQILPIISSWQKVFTSLLLLLQIIRLVPIGGIASVISSPFTIPANHVRETVNTYVKKTNGPILSDDVGYLVINNIPVIYDSIMFGILNRYNTFAKSRIADDCLQKKFSLIVAINHIYNISGMKACLEKQYELVESLDFFDRKNYFRIYKPKQ